MIFNEILAKSDRWATTTTTAATTSTTTSVTLNWSDIEEGSFRLRSATYECRSVKIGASSGPLLKMTENKQFLFNVGQL